MFALLCYLLAIILCTLAAFHAHVGSVALFPLGVAFIALGLILSIPLNYMQNLTR